MNNIPEKANLTRGDVTRQALITTAIAIFGRDGFDAASTRAISQAAGVNQALIGYHFGGKQGLYLATAEFLADTMKTRLDPMLSKVGAAAGDADPETAAALLDEMIHGLVHNLLGNPLGDDAAGFILREQHQPTAAFDILYERLMLPIQQGFQSLASRLSGINTRDARRDILTTHALMGQIIAFRMARTTVLRRLGQPGFSEDDVAAIATVISRLTLNALRDQSLETTPP
jgi:AcrR family transcriptional regulator